MQENEKINEEIVENEVPTENEVINTSHEEVATSDNQGDEVPKFATIDDYNKFIQSTSSKAKGELLKEIGLENVKDIKEAIKNSNSVKGLLDKLNSVENELNTLRSEKKTMEDKALLNELGIAPDKGDLFLKLVDADTTENKSRHEKALHVKQSLLSLVQPTTKVGVDKTPSNEPTAKTRDELEYLRKL